MFDLKYFDINTPTLSNQTPTPKSLHLTQPRSNFTSPTHHHKCIPHLTGLALTGNYMISFDAGYTNTHIYLDISVGMDTQLSHITVYVLVVDFYMIGFVAGYRVEDGGFLVRDGVIAGSDS